MIKEIRYKNFKALRDTTLPLGRFTLIVGANGTGKSTALKGLKILMAPHLFAWENISSANYENLVTEIEISSIYKENPVWIKAVWKVGEKGKYDFEVIDDDERNDWYEDFVKDAIKYFRTFHSYDFDSNKIANSVSITPIMSLDSSGNGLAGVLWDLQNSEPEVFEKMNQELRKWFPDFDRVVFEIPEDGKVSFLLRTAFGKHKIKAEDLSDGTRLALAYLTLAHLPNPPKIVAFEEPERGIHPRLLQNMQEAMYRLAYPENYGEKREPIQVIATTHSPYLLDLYKDNPEEIVIAEKDEDGVHFENLAKMESIDKILRGGESLGEVWFTGVLGGVPAHI